jgi:hypothetical protein
MGTSALLICSVYWGSWDSVLQISYLSAALIEQLLNLAEFHTAGNGKHSKVIQ